MTEVQGSRFESGTFCELTVEVAERLPLDLRRELLLLLGKKGRMME